MNKEQHYFSCWKAFGSISSFRTSTSTTKTVPEFKLFLPSLSIFGKSCRGQLIRCNCPVSAINPTDQNLFMDFITTFPLHTITTISTFTKTTQNCPLRCIETLVNISEVLYFFHYDRTVTSLSRSSTRTNAELTRPPPPALAKECAVVTDTQCKKRG